MNVRFRAKHTLTFAQFFRLLSVLLVGAGRLSSALTAGKSHPENLAAELGAWLVEATSSSSASLVEASSTHMPVPS